MAPPSASLWHRVRRHRPSVAGGVTVSGGTVRLWPAVSPRQAAPSVCGRRCRRVRRHRPSVAGGVTVSEESVNLRPVPAGRSRLHGQLAPAARRYGVG